jgi:hypothetical protein
MLFQVTHVHAREPCPGATPEGSKRAGEWWHALKQTAGIKVLSGYGSSVDHTFHLTVETDDYQRLVRALGPLNAIGTGHVTPVLTIDEAIPMADQGAFRPR